MHKTTEYKDVDYENLLKNFLQCIETTNYKFDLEKIIYEVCEERLGSAQLSAEIVNDIVKGIKKQHKEYMQYLPRFSYFKSIEKIDDGYFKIMMTMYGNIDWDYIPIYIKMNDKNIILSDKGNTVERFLDNDVDLTISENEDKINEVLEKYGIKNTQNELSMVTNKSKYFDDLETFIQALIDIDRLPFEYEDEWKYDE